MKNIILVLSIAMSFASCSKNGEQIEVAKNKLKQQGKSETEIQDTKFNVVEMIDKDVYNILYDKKNKTIIETMSVGGDYKQMEKESENLASEIRNSKGEKKFFKVQFFRLADKDTVSNSIIYLNDKNEELGFEYLK